MRQPGIRLVAFDMEGCLTTDPTVWEIMHRKLGTWASHGEPYWRRYRAGEFAYDQFARMDVAVWGGARLSDLAEAAREVALTPGCAEVLARLHAAGVRTAVISNGLMCVADRFREEHGVEFIHANRAETDDGLLTGGISILVPYEGKGRVLCALAAKLGLHRDEIASVGDSSSDMAMFAASRISVAFNPAHPEIAVVATHVLRHNLSPLLEILLH